MKPRILAIFSAIILASSFLPSCASEQREVQKAVLDNGLTLLVQEVKGFDIASMVLLVKLPCSLEDEHNLGIRNFVHQMLLKGTEKRSAVEIASQVEDIGATLTPGVTEDYAMLTSSVLNEFSGEILAIMADVTFNATFPEEEVGRARATLIQQASRQRIIWREVIRLFTQTHFASAYSYPPEGRPQTLAKINRQDLVDFYTRYYQPSNMILAVVGDLDSAEVRGAVEEVFGKFSSSPVSIPEVIEEEHTSIKEAEEQRWVASAALAIGYSVPTLRDQLYPQVLFLQSYLGEKIFDQIREERGWSYAAHVTYLEFANSGCLVAFCDLNKKENLDQARQVILGVIRGVKEGISEEDMEQHKTAVLGKIARGGQTSWEKAPQLVWYELYGLPYDFDDELRGKIEELTCEDIESVADKYFKDNYTYVAIIPLW